jgi:hypothetical protein
MSAILDRPQLFKKFKSFHHYVKKNNGQTCIEIIKIETIINKGDKTPPQIYANKKTLQIINQ